MVALAASICASRASAADKSDGPVTVRYMLWGTQDEFAALHDQLSTVFEPANPTIHVEAMNVSGSNYQIKLATMMAAGLAPDVVNIHSAFRPTAVENGLIMPLDDLLANDPEADLSGIDPDVVNKCRYHDGRLYHLPTTGNVVVMYYNKDYFDKAGLKYPDDSWTWDNLLAAAKTLTIRDSNGHVVQWGLEGTGWLHWLNFIWQNEGEVFDKDSHLVIGKPEYIDRNVEALQFLQDLIQVHKVTRYFSDADVQPVDQLIGGQVAISLNGSWENGSLIRAWKELKAKGEEKSMIRWGVAQLPMKRARATLGGYGGPVITHDTPHLREAWQVLKFFTSQKWQENVARQGEIPSLKSVLESDLFLHQEGIPADVDLREELKSFAYSHDEPSGPKVSELMEKQLATMVDSISIGRIKDIRAALLELQKAVDTECPYCAEER